MLPFLIAGFIIPERTLGADVVLKTFALGKIKAIRVVPTEGQPRCRVSTSLNGICPLNPYEHGQAACGLEKLQIAIRRISEINAVMDKGTHLRYAFQRGITGSSWGYQQPDRLYLDFRKQEKGLSSRKTFHRQLRRNL
jgi:hypothetical protein